MRGGEGRRRGNRRRSILSGGGGAAVELPGQWSVSSAGRAGQSRFGSGSGGGGGGGLPSARRCVTMAHHTLVGTRAGHSGVSYRSWPGSQGGSLYWRRSGLPNLSRAAGIGRDVRLTPAAKK